MEDSIPIHLYVSSFEEYTQFVEYVNKSSFLDVRGTPSVLKWVQIGNDRYVEDRMSLNNWMLRLERTQPLDILRWLVVCHIEFDVNEFDENASVPVPTKVENLIIVPNQYISIFVVHAILLFLIKQSPIPMRFMRSFSTRPGFDGLQNEYHRLFIAHTNLLVWANVFPPNQEGYAWWGKFDMWNRIRARRLRKLAIMWARFKNLPGTVQRMIWEYAADDFDEEDDIDELDEDL